MWTLWASRKGPGREKKKPRAQSAGREDKAMAEPVHGGDIYTLAEEYAGPILDFPPT